ncbi:MAG: recombination regulator RecX [Nitrosomonadales bacterium]|nr:recombination regulator RecX [Nitrosomonadales bacterium]
MGKKPEPGLRTRALKLLARREYSRAELRDRLSHAQTDEDSGPPSPEQVDALLDDLVERGWLSDARAAAQLVHARRDRFGTRRIAHELRQKGIAENLIADTLPELKESELEAAQEVWQKKFGVAPHEAKEKARQVRFLQSRGFSMDVIFRVIRGAGDAGDE